MTPGRSKTPATNPAQAAVKPYALPDPPEREPDDMTSSKHLAETGNHHYLIEHFGNPETTIISGERYICLAPGENMRYPDLLVAFNADRRKYLDNNGYIISEQGKPPDFVLEIASPATARVDTEEKPRFYAGLGIPEYWRFDETGQFHGTRLAGDRLAGSRYEPIPITELAEGVLEGYSPVLALLLRWEHGQLGWYDPRTQRHINTLRQERQARLAAEARVRELEERLRNSRGAG